MMMISLQLLRIPLLKLGSSDNLLFPNSVQNWLTRIAYWPFCNSFEYLA